MADVRSHWKATTRPSAPTELRHRPSKVPLEAQCRSIMYQLQWDSARVVNTIATQAHPSIGGFSALLKSLKDSMARHLGCEIKELRLDHNPALSLRDYDATTEKYTPDANDYYFMKWRVDHGHDIKTYVHGDGAQRSDTAERMHRRRLDENRGHRKRKPKKKIHSRGFGNTSKVKWRWPKRKFGQ